MDYQTRVAMCRIAGRYPGKRMGMMQTVNELQPPLYSCGCRVALVVWDGNKGTKICVRCEGDFTQLSLLA